jgi:hypothetical protein
MAKREDKVEVSLLVTLAPVLVGGSIHGGIRRGGSAVNNVL